MIFAVGCVSPLCFPAFRLPVSDNSPRSKAMCGMRQESRLPMRKSGLPAWMQTGSIRSSRTRKVTIFIAACRLASLTHCAGGGAPSGRRKRHSDPARDSAHRRHLFGGYPGAASRQSETAGPQDAGRMVLYQADGDSRRVHSLPQTAPQSSQAAQGGAPEANQRAEQLKQRQSLTDAFSAGVAALDEKRYTDAIVFFKKALDADPKQSLVGHPRFGVCQVGGNSDRVRIHGGATQGLDAYAKSIELKPDEAVVHNNYALALARPAGFQRCARKSNGARLSTSRMPTMLTTIWARRSVMAATWMKRPPHLSGRSMPCRNREFGSLLCICHGVDEQSGDWQRRQNVAGRGNHRGAAKISELAPQGPNASAAKELLAALAR